ncbi:hypothetical protein Q7P37_008938 [Cladosporium fusiforme]
MAAPIEQHRAVKPKFRAHDSASSNSLTRQRSAPQSFGFAHFCSDTLCQLRCESSNRGPDDVWRRLPEFVVELSYAVQDPQQRNKYDVFMINEIFRPSGITNPVDFTVIIGRAAVRLGILASTEIGSAALRDLFATPRFPRLTNRAIEQCLQIWRDRADRITFDEQNTQNLYQVFPSPTGRRILWNTGVQCEYTFESLAATEAGHVLLTMPLSPSLSVALASQALASPAINTAPEVDGDSRHPQDIQGQCFFEDGRMESNSHGSPKRRWKWLLRFVLCSPRAKASV